MNIVNEEIRAIESKLKMYRVSSGMTQNELAQLSGINVKSIAAYEQTPEKINKASVDTIAKIAECLDCSIEDLLQKA